MSCRFLSSIFLCLRRWLRSVMSTPLNQISPPVGWYRFITHRATVDFPEPDSPTSPKISPRRTWKDRSSSACTASFRVSLNRWLRCRTSKMRSSMEHPSCGRRHFGRSGD